MGKVEETRRRFRASRKANDERRLEPLEWELVRSEVFSRDNYTCGYCGYRGGVLECDHVVPIARGGSNDIVNLITSCKPCNQSKGAKLLTEWRQ